MFLVQLQSLTSILLKFLSFAETVGMAARKGHVVLCVDDEAVGLKVRRILLERAGYEVLTASDGQSGLQMFRTHDVDAVVLDYSMPGMSGGDVARAMRQIKPDVPILLLSAYVGLHDEVRSIVDIYMTKGEGAPALLERLSNLLTNPSASQEIPGTEDPQ